MTRSSGGVTWAYGYDALDRLVSVRRNSVLIARYGYDVLGRRIVKRVYSSASGGTVGYTRFVYKGSHVSFETDSAGTIGLRYTWGAGTDDLVAITTAAGLHYYVTTDKLGSVRSIAKRDGTWQLSQRFDPYGRPIARDSATGSTIGAQLRYGWTGREWDAETGFSYHRARYFDPESRRWTQEDPIGYAGGMNVYAYVGGSPMEATDPSGLETELDRTLTPYCTWGGSCIGMFGNVTRHRQQYSIDGVMVGMGGGIGALSWTWSVELVAEFADGSQVPCAKVASQCEAFLRNNADLLMSRPDLRAQIDGVIAEARAATIWPYSVEAGGWCTATQCSGKLGTLFHVSLGSQPTDAILGWHSHPNEGLLVADSHTLAKCNGAASCRYGWDISREDLVNAMNRQYTVPMYVIAPGIIRRYQWLGGSSFDVHTVWTAPK